MKKLFLCIMLALTCSIGAAAIDETVQNNESEVITNEVSQETNVSDFNTVQTVRSDTRTVQQVIINGQPIAVYTVPNPYRTETAAFIGDVYAGSVSTNVLEYLSGFIPPMNDYLIYRSGQYTYNLYYGTDFTLSGTTVSGSGRRVTYDTSAYTFGYADATFSIDTGNAAYVYSNLEGFSDYSAVKEARNDSFTHIVLFAIFIADCLRWIWK
ncbi:MAG: hypothetical protein IJ410_02610 [Oscillospiraceae bacterium]|nr:hypothetical protein [Oscillospiraceae bacterium]